MDKNAGFSIALQGQLRSNLLQQDVDHVWNPNGSASENESVASGKRLL